jgi:hypothetical protein
MGWTSSLRLILGLGISTTISIATSLKQRLGLGISTAKGRGLSWMQGVGTGTSTGTGIGLTQGVGRQTLHPHPPQQEGAQEDPQECPHRTAWVVARRAARTMAEVFIIKFIILKSGLL